MQKPTQNRLQTVRRLSYLLDSAFPIPGTNLRVGLDPIIGLIPGIGDAITSLMSTYIILLALQMRVSKWTIVRMLINILIESVIGIVPLFGDIFDAFWKANEKNRRLLEAAVEVEGGGKNLNRIFVIGVVLSLLAIFAMTVVAAFWILRWLVQLL